MNHAVRGRLAGVAAALSYGVITTFSKMAYDGGANPASVLVFRFLAGSALLGLVVAVTGRGWRLALPSKKFVLLVFSWYAISFGHLGAVNFIPVSLAAIIFYTFPLLVVAYNRLVLRSPVTVLDLIGFILAFIGLCIALGPTLADSDWRGIVLASAASVSAAVFLILYERAGREADEITAAFWLSFGALLLGALVMLGGFSFAPPVTPRGILGISGVGVFGMVAFLLNLTAIRLAGAAPTAMLLNLEPVVIFVMAAVLIGEEITAARGIGLALVLAALTLSQWPALSGGHKAGK